MGKILSTRKEICKFFGGRSWKTIQRWIAERGCPVRFIDGRWESDEDLLLEWRRKTFFEREAG